MHSGPLPVRTARRSPTLRLPQSVTNPTSTRTAVAINMRTSNQVARGARTGCGHPRTPPYSSMADPNPAPFAAPPRSAAPYSEEPSASRPFGPAGSNHT